MDIRKLVSGGNNCVMINFSDKYNLLKLKMAPSLDQHCKRVL